MIQPEDTTIYTATSCISGDTKIKKLIYNKRIILSKKWIILFKIQKLTNYL